jgi:hypothetical protein
MFDVGRSGEAGLSFSAFRRLISRNPFASNSAAFSPRMFLSGLPRITTITRSPLRWAVAATA